MKNNFDRLAFAYDWLSHVVFGKSIKDAQGYYLKGFVANAKVLVVGGGTGWVLNELDKQKRKFSVTYIEPSVGMMKRAMKREPFQYIEVEYVQEEYKINESRKFSYDVIITNFFLDVFNEEELSAVMDNLSKELKPGGQWLFTDFVKTDKNWQKLLVWAMYRFFRVTAGLEGAYLVDFDQYFEMFGFRAAKSKLFYSGMIKSGVYHPLIPS